MNYLGENRVVTNPFSSHITAEDYAGSHESKVSIYGTGKVVKVINKFHCHEDSINYNNFLKNKASWKDGNYYNCISITGKEVRMHYEELGGNQVFIETYENGSLLLFRIAHLASVSVNVGDIVDENTIIGYQGNTGLVLSSKPNSDVTYGSHVHLEVTDSNGNYKNPRMYANGSIYTHYVEQSNVLNPKKYQFKVNVDKINIREKPTVESSDIGDVFLNEIYDILEEVDSEQYTWYKITTSRGVTGYVANLKNSNWMTLYYPNQDLEPDYEVDDKTDDFNNDSSLPKDEKVIFECKEEGYYYIYLYSGEKLLLKS